MAIFKSIGEKLRLFLFVITALAILFGSAWAIINIAGKSIVPGKGLYYGSGPVVDTMNFRTSYLMIFSGDSIVPDTAHLKIIFDNTFTTPAEVSGLISDTANNLVRLAYVQNITGVKHFTDTLVAGTQGVDGIFKIYSDSGITDYGIVFKPHVTMTQTTVYTWPANDGDASQYLQSDGSGNLVWAIPTGAGDMLKSTYDIAINGVVDDVDTVGTQINTALAKRATKVMLTDTCWSLHNLWKADISDSMWNPTFLPQTGRLAISEGSNDSIQILYPIRTATVSWAVKHMNTSVQVDQMDTVTFSWKIPLGVPDVDSITFNMLSTSLDTAKTGLRVRAYKQTAELGALTALTATLPAFFTATPVWTHKTIAGASIGAIAGGNDLFIDMCVQLDADSTVWHDEPKVWHLGKQ